MSQPFLTAIIPNYNHAAFIGKAVDALLSQSLPPDEIIIIDDASTDHSLEVIAGIVAAHKNTVRLIEHKTNLGAIAALNRGLQETQARYIYFGSADDVTHPSLLQSMTEMLEAYPAAALACGETRLIDKDDNVVGYRPIARPANYPRHFSPLDARKLIRKTDHWILTGASVYRRALIAAVGGFNGNFGSFADGFVSKLLALKYGFCFSPGILADWRIDPEGYSRSSAADPQTSLELIAKIRQAITDEASVFPCGYDDLYTRRWRFAVCRLAVDTWPRNLEVLRALGPSGKLWQQYLTAFAEARPLAFSRFMLLAWLTLRLWPTSPFQVVKTLITRSISKDRA